MMKAAAVAALAPLLALAPLPGRAADHPWMSDAGLVAAAQKDGSVTFYSSTNEDEQHLGVLGRIGISFADHASAALPESDLRPVGRGIDGQSAHRAGKLPWEA